LTQIGSAVGFNNFDETIGWEFQANANLTVQALGVIDLGPFAIKGSLSNAHAVGLWTSTGTLLGEVTVPAGTASTAVGAFRYVDLTSPVSLQMGQHYVLGAFFPGGGFDGSILSAFNGAAVTIDPNITLLDGRINTTGFPPTPNLAFPDQNFIAGGDFGPSFEFTASLATTTPEPASLTLLGLGLAGLAGFRRRRLNA
jgi:hypothetical protein